VSARDSKGRFLPGTHWRPPSIFRERTYLVREYVELKRSTSDLAAEHGVTYNAILFWLNKHGIKRRTISEARAVKYWGSLGPKNPMFGRKGRLNPRYVDGSSPERQRAYASSAWKTLVVSVYQRDSFTCRRCHSKRSPRLKLTAHHVKPWAGNPELRFALHNLVTLCQKCHCWVHSKKNVEREWLA
jgi:hypothetical protein